MRQDSARNAAKLNPKPGLKSWPISAVAAAQTGQRCVFLLHFLSEKNPENASFILNFPPIFVPAERQDEGELRS